MYVCMYVPCEEDLSFHWRGHLHIPQIGGWGGGGGGSGGGGGGGGGGNKKNLNLTFFFFFFFFNLTKWQREGGTVGQFDGLSPNLE